MAAGNRSSEVVFIVTGRNRTQNEDLVRVGVDPGGQIGRFLEMGRKNQLFSKTKNTKKEKLVLKESLQSNWLVLYLVKKILNVE